MGLFKRRTMAERQAESMQMANDIAEGRGLTGKLTQAFMGREFTEAMQQATGAMNQGQLAAQLRAAGHPTRTARVLGLQDTGQMINNDPVVLLVLEVDGHQVSLQSLVSKLEIPRTGDLVLLVDNPQQPGTVLYAGLAPQGGAGVPGGQTVQTGQAGPAQWGEQPPAGQTQPARQPWDRPQH
ncbi:hypothetical protein EXU48_08940 [Occultella glacieicola]|uniref:Uncharacterized protein n=1 Tax=Occultella glacieicola TaxID=2518684 RepID=A0ABY2E4F8_9MICO|nr:hypothetical protein [Occultella glacieicola]TDE94901.1 hypothetical protein EXU48_08940 [Occultella glacieicola]